MFNESTGAIIKNFSLKLLRNYRLVFPPKDIQVKIVGQLELIEKKHDYVGKYLSSKYQ